jgi:hypothetical protein
MLYPVAVGTDDCQIRKPRVPDQCGFGARDDVMAFREPLSDPAVDIEEVESASLARKPAVSIPDLLNLGSNDSPISLQVDMQPRQNVAFGKYILFINPIRALINAPGGNSSLDRFSRTTQQGRIVDEFRPNTGVQLVASRQPRLAMQWVNSKEIAHDHRNAGRIADILIPRRC